MLNNNFGNIGMIAAWTMVLIFIGLIGFMYYAQHEAIDATIVGLDDANNDSYMLGEGVPDVTTTFNIIKWSWAFAFVILIVGLIGFGIMYSLKREEDSRRRF